VTTGTPATATLTFTFTSSGTIAAVAVLTDGVQNLDFTDAGTGSCTANGPSFTYFAGNTCTVNVNFKTQFAGTRSGAVILYNSLNRPITTAYIYGTGTGPQVAFSPVTQTTLNWGSLARYNAQWGLAVDDAGNIYVADYNANDNYYSTLEKIPAGCLSSSCVEARGGYFDGPDGVAVDGAGNIYVVDTPNDAVYEVPPNCYSANCEKTLGGGFSSPTGVAVDGSGNVYVANSTVYEMPSGCTSAECMTTLGGGPIGAGSVAVDGSGNVYTAGAYVAEMPPGCTSSSCVTKLGGGIADTGSVAVDASGSIYVSVSPFTGSSIDELKPGCTSSQCIATLATGFSRPTGVATDEKGNVYVADNINQDSVTGPWGVVDTLDRTEAPSLTFADTIAGETSAPQTVTILNIGNEPLKFSALSYPRDFPEVSGVATDCTSSMKLAVGASCTLSIDFAPLPASFTGASTPLSETVSLTTNNLNGTDVVQSVAVTGTVVGATMLAYGTQPAFVIPVGGNAGSAITVDEELSDGAVSTASADPITLTVTYPDASKQIYQQTAVNGVATFNLSAATLTEPGSYTYTASSTDLTSATDVETVVPVTNVGSTTGAVQTATLTAVSDFTLGSIGVLTGGAPNLDFKVAPGGTCAVGTDYSADQTCTVNYTFNPIYPGARGGAVVLYDNASPANAEATTFLLNIGTGPQVVFSPSTQTRLATGGGSVGDVAVDGGGNVYLSGPGGVKEAPPGCTSPACVKSLPGSFASPGGLAVDGAGNVYVTDIASSTVSEIPAGCASSSCVTLIGGGFAGPYSVAVDGAGNVYVTEPSNTLIKKIPRGCTSAHCVTVLASGFDRYGLTTMAADVNGNIYVGGFELPSGYVGGFELPYGCDSISCAKLLPEGYVNSVAVDGAGNVYAIDETELDVNVIPAGCSSSSCVISIANDGLGIPEMLAVDVSGDVYILYGYGSSLQRLHRTEAPILTLAPTVDGQTSASQTATVQNIGNAPLTFPVPAKGNNPVISNSKFSVDSSVANACPLISSGSDAVGTLAAGTGCNLSLSFSPGADTYGNISGTLALTDNTLNAVAPKYATQTIKLSGAADPPYGAIDQPLDVTTGSTKIAFSDSMLVTGWAYDPHDGAPVSTVTVQVDGVAIGNATLGVVRTDVVASENNNPAFLDSGWSFTYPPYLLSALEPHVISAVVTDSLGVSTQLPYRTFYVVTTPVSAPPFGVVIHPVDATTRAKVVAQADSMLVTGWAADVHDGAPVASVSITIDGTAVGNATLGIARPDVVAAENNNAAFLNSGWSFTYPAAGLSLGTHNVRAVVTNSLGLSTTFGPFIVTVSATPMNGSPFGALGMAVDATTQSTTVSQTHNLLVSGWAADYHDGAPVAKVSILIDGAAAGNATLGIARPDVAKAEGNSKYLDSGWTFTTPASGLAVGMHTVTAVATDSLGLSTQFPITVITVSP
jgi:sugar lactone lactonase YvrE